MNTSKIKLSRSVFTLACLAAAAVLPFTAQAKQVLYSEDFNEFSENRPVEAFGWARFVSGAPGAPIVNSSGTTVMNPSTNPGNRMLFLNVNATAGTNWWSAGLYHNYSHSLPTTDLSKLSLTVNVWGGGSVGPVGDVVLRIESSTNNWIGFIVDGQTLAASPGLLLGGLLSEANASNGTFDISAESFRITVGFSNPKATWGNDASNVITIDNVELAFIPEQSHLALGAGLVCLLLGLVSRRSRGRG